MNKDEGILKVTVRDGSGQKAPVREALVLVSTVSETREAKQSEITDLATKLETNAKGQATVTLEPGTYSVDLETFVEVEAKRAKVEMGQVTWLDFRIPIGLELDVIPCGNGTAQNTYPELIPSGTPIRAHIRTREMEKLCKDFRTEVEFQFTSTGGSLRLTSEREAVLDTTGLTGPVTLSGTLREVNTSSMTVSKRLHLVVAEGAHNQFGDLPATARIE